MASAVVDPGFWQELWTAAYTGGRTSAAIELANSVVSVGLRSAGPYFEAAKFLDELRSNLAGVERLYDRHRKAFGLEPEDLTWRPSGFPLARDCISQIAALLRNACNAAPENATGQHSLADSLERLCELDEAIRRRENIARNFPAFPENERALLRLLERTGDLDRAASYAGSLIVGGATVPEHVLALARILDRRGETRKVELLCERLRARVLGQDGNSHERIEFLFRLAWTAARDGLPAGAGQLHRDLCDRCAAAARGNFSDAKARLAEGFASLIDGNADRAKASFAIASWIVSRSEHDNIDLAAVDTFSSALQYARAFVLDLAPILGSGDETPCLRNCDLALVHSHWLHRSGRLIDALTEVARWLAVVPDAIPPRMYKGHRITRRNGVYFGIPLSEERFTIIGGKAYRITPFVILIAKLVPIRVRAMLRGSSSPTTSSNESKDADAGAPEIRVRTLQSHSWMKRLALTLARPLLAGRSISTALQSPNLDKLFADIDRQLVSTDLRIEGRPAADYPPRR